MPEADEIPCMINVLGEAQLLRKLDRMMLRLLMWRVLQCYWKISRKCEDVKVIVLADKLGECIENVHLECDCEGVCGMMICTRELRSLQNCRDNIIIRNSWTNEFEQVVKFTC